MDDAGQQPRRHRSGWASAGVTHRDGQSKVTNLDFAIYCFMLHTVGEVHLPVLQVLSIARGRHEIVFEDPDDVVSKLELEFTNREGHGEAAKWAKTYATSQRDLKVIMRRVKSDARTR